MKDNQHEQLFTELTPAEGAVVEGGKSFTADIILDDKFTTQQFQVSPGATIKLDSLTNNFEKPISSNPNFSAIIRNVNTGRTTPPKTVNVGKDTTTWTNLRGGTYAIDFRDSKDNIYVVGGIDVSYS
jgi:hypothetical protein